MRLINDAVLKDTYDVIVFGAGLGGMTAASLIAKRGLSVLMIDQQDKPGGSCTSFRRVNRRDERAPRRVQDYGPIMPQSPRRRNGPAPACRWA